MLFSDEERLLKLAPAKYRSQAAALIRQFQNRGNELTWNSDGVIFIDQVSIPQSNIFALFPYLFKHKHPKTLNGFQDFVQKIREMQLQHLIVTKTGQSISPQVSTQVSNADLSRNSQNWWYLGD